MTTLPSHMRSCVSHTSSVPSQHQRRSCCRSRTAASTVCIWLQLSRLDISALLQVYVALCRLSQNSDAAAREAVRNGIDLMIPCLAKAAAAEAMAGPTGPSLMTAVVPIEAAAESLLSKDSATSGPSASALASTTAAGSASLSGSPSYARYLKRVLSEDGHASSTLVHLLQIIVRNRDMFYLNR